MKEHTKDMAIECLETLFNSSGQTQIDRNMYNYLKGFIEQKDEVKVVKNEGVLRDLRKRFLEQDEEITKLKRQLELQMELANLYKSRVKKAFAILKGNND